MNVTPHLQSEARPEAMSDVPGVCELPLTRAIVQYRDVHEIDFAGGRIQDIGLGLVLEGRYASSTEIVDLGSGTLKLLDLSAELVVLDWAYDPTLEHANGLVRSLARTTPGSDEHEQARRTVERFCFRLALNVIERVGFGPLTRPSLLRIGYRDICRDLDMHEGTSVRIVPGPGRVIRVHLDYDTNALLFRTAGEERDPSLESALAGAFPSGEVRRLVPSSPGRAGGYQLRFPLPGGLREVREELGAIRSGLLHLLSRFEPRRFDNLERIVGTFGRRETLARLDLREPDMRYAALSAGPATVH